jgi:hypothetical protein
VPNWFRSHRPSPSMLVAIVAVVIATASSAVAASTIINSSSQIKDGVILGRDLQDNTLTGAKLRDGSFAAADLTQGARDALRGPQGVKGDRGVQGKRGLQGPEGTAAISLVNYANTTVGIAAGAAATGNAACPKGLRPIGGGARNPSGKLVVSATYPVAGSRPGWAVTALNPDAAEHPLVVEAVCAPVKRVS